MTTMGLENQRPHLEDVDGDGVADLVVGAVGDDTGGEDRGALYVLRMNANGSVKSSTKIASGLNGGPTLANGDGFGYSIGAMGDFDGDGVTDLAVGAYGDDTGGENRGAVYLLLMNSNGTVKGSTKLASGVNGVPVLSNGDAFGSAVASLSDLDGDGIVDLAVGAYSDDTSGVDAGAVHILFLNANGTVKNTNKIRSYWNHSAFGSSLASGGDITGDGIPDLIVGSYAADNGGTRRGTLDILTMNRNGTTRNIARYPQSAPLPLSDHDILGAAVAVIDLNGDGYMDVIGGAPSDGDGTSNNGSIYTILDNAYAESVKEVTLPSGGGSYEAFVSDDYDAVVRVTGGEELLRCDLSLIQDLIIHGSDAADIVTVQYNWYNNIRFDGGGGNDRFDASRLNSTFKMHINGGDGNDTLIGGPGSDVIRGGNGNDFLDGVQGFVGDTLMGMNGDDTLQSGSAVSHTFDGGDGTDVVNKLSGGDVTILGDQFQGNSYETDTLSGIEQLRLTGGSGADYFNARNATMDIVLIGNGGSDTLIGGSGNDTVQGNDGDDVLVGSAGTDVIDGGAGSDTWFESADANFAIYGTQIVSLATGDETAASVERIALEGGIGNNKLNAINSSVPVLLVGGPGNDTLTGSSGDDTLTGGFRGDSSVPGSDGVDSLNGRSGQDILKNDTADSLSGTSGDTLLANVFSLLPAWLDLI